MAKNDPYNSNYGDRNKSTKAAMKNAYRNPGVDPQNSHTEQSKKWQKSWRDQASRLADKDAKARAQMDKGTPAGMSRATRYQG